MNVKKKKEKKKRMNGNKLLLVQHLMLLPCSQFVAPWFHKSYPH